VQFSKVSERLQDFRRRRGDTASIEPWMEATMLDDEAGRRARQDMLEALSSGMLGPSMAPMPGVLIEMMEIAAISRHRDGAGTRSATATSTLTSKEKHARIEFKIRQTWTAILHAVDALRTRLRGDRRLPARPPARSSAA
jgi:hypothetical protein